MAVVIPTRKKKPVRDLLLQAESVGCLEMIVPLLDAECPVLVLSAQVQETHRLAARVIVVQFGAETILDSDAPNFVVQIELKNMDLLIDLFARGIDFLGIGRIRIELWFDRPHIAPLQQRFLSIAVTKLISKNHSRPIRQCEPEIHEGASNIQMQILAQVERGWGEARIISSGVVVILAILLKTEAREAEIALFK